MRILLLISELDRGGAETHLCDLAQSLTERGHRVTVASAGGGMVMRLTAYGIKHEVLRWNTRHPLRLLVARGRLIRLIKRARYDVIHAHSRLPAALAAGVARRRKLPLITTVHARFRVSPVLRRLSRWGDRTITVSEDLSEYVREEYGVSRQQITVIPNGINTKRFLPMVKKRAEDKLRVLFFSRLDGDCSLGAELLCDIAPRLKKEFPQFELWIGGGGEKTEYFRRKAELLCRQDPTLPVRILGAVEDPERLFLHVQAVVGVSRCALEAMSCAIPVILGGDEGFLGVAEGERLAKGARSNFCCRGEDAMTADKLLDALRELLSRSEEERNKLGRTLRAYVEKYHGHAQMAERTEAVYRLAIEEKEASRQGVLLCGYYGFGNMGDEVLLRAAVRRARREFPTYSVSALTKRGKWDEDTFGIPCVRRSSPLALRRAVKRSSVLVFGGGTLLQDHTSLRSLLYYAGLLRYGQKKGLRTLLWGNGLSPSHTALGACVMRSALVGCDYVGLRDDASVAVARELLGKNCVLPIRRETDLVLSYPPDEPQPKGETARRLGLSTGNFVILAPKGSAGRGMLKLFRERAVLWQGEGVIPVVIPLFPKEDGRLCRRLCKELGGVLPEGLTPSEVVDLVRESRGVYGMRLHALVFAAIAGVPFVGFGTDTKIEAFCRERGGVYFTDLYGKK